VSQYVRITDVSPRDGLQNEAAPISTDQKLALISALARSGVAEIELTSFVSPRWVPQLADAAEVLERAATLRHDGLCLSVLIPNEKGLERALEIRDRTKALDKISVFTAASETFARKNTNASIDETIERFRPVVDTARCAGLVVRGYVSCAIACPFEGPIAPESVARVAARLLALGVDEIDLGDTIGAGTPDTIGRLIETMFERLGNCRETDLAEPCLTLHLHDTNGQAAECVRKALALGVRSFDGSAAGLGGCPYASTPGARAPGNISTESLVAAVEEQGFSTGVDRVWLAEASRVASALVAESPA
jgi:hydroxymethylglutaryl-CoA lyase